MVWEGLGGAERKRQACGAEGPIQILLSTEVRLNDELLLPDPRCGGYFLYCMLRMKHLDEYFKEPTSDAYDTSN